MKNSLDNWKKKLLKIEMVRKSSNHFQKTNVNVEMCRFQPKMCMKNKHFENNNVCDSKMLKLFRVREVRNAKDFLNFFSFFGSIK